MDDEELAAELEDSAELLGLISPAEWRDVLKVKARATVLELAAAAGWPAVKKFLTFIDGCRDGVYEYDAAMVAEARELIMEGMTGAIRSCAMFVLKFRKCPRRWGGLCCSRHLRMLRGLLRNSGPMQFGR